MESSLKTFLLLPNMEFHFLSTKLRKMANDVEFMEFTEKEFSSVHKEFSSIMKTEGVFFPFGSLELDSLMLPKMPF